MKKIFTVLLALSLLVLSGCGQTPPVETPEETTPTVETPSCTEDPVPAEHLRVLLIDQNKDGKNDYKIVVDPEAAKSTEKVPFRLPDEENPSEDSFSTVRMYRLTAEGETLVWYTNLCMGSAPRGGVALKDGMVFGYYYDIYEYGEGRKVSISCYEYVGNAYGTGYRPHANSSSFITAEISDEMWEDNFGERNSFSLRVAVDTLDEMLDDAEILLDVTGTQPIFSTDEERFTKQYSFRFDYRDLEGSLAEENQDSYIQPIS